MALSSHLLLKPLPSLSSSKTTLVHTQPLARIPMPHSSCSRIDIFSDSPNPLQSSPNQSLDFFYHPQTAAATTISSWDALIRPLVTQSLQSGLPIMCKEIFEEEIVITTLVSGDSRASNGLDVYVHFGAYVPIAFGGRESGARLVVVGPGREIANAKFSEWVRVRKGLEKLRPPSVTELLLSNDGDRILEGSVLNFFVVCSRDVNEALGDLNEARSGFPFEVQTAPVSGGVLPGVIRQLIVEVCSSLGIPLREVAPSWANHELWKEAFVKSSLRLVQHVEKVQAPSSWESLQSKTWKEVSWVEKEFEGPGPITTEIQIRIQQCCFSHAFLAACQHFEVEAFGISSIELSG